MTDKAIRGVLKQLEDWLLKNGFKINELHPHEHVEFVQILSEFDDEAYEDGYRDGIKAARVLGRSQAKSTDNKCKSCRGAGRCVACGGHGWSVGWDGHSINMCSECKQNEGVCKQCDGTGHGEETELIK